MEFFNDEERRMFLRAMARERVVCEEADRNYPQEESLTSICDSIVKKVNQAVSVRHGHWEEIRNAYGELEGWMCECGIEVKCASDFCPYCGAKMDEPSEG